MSTSFLPSLHGGMACAVAPDGAQPNPTPSAEDAVILSTLDGVITDWNAGAEHCFGYRRQEAFGQSLSILVPNDRADEHRSILGQVRHGRSAFRADAVRRHKNGCAVNVRLTMSGLRDHFGKPVAILTVAHDLARVHLLEQQLSLAQKMHVFGQLTSGVAHDFNNLLTVILGYSEVVLSQLTFNDGLRELVGAIHTAGARAETLTRQLLTYGRRGGLDPKTLDINAVVSDTEKMLRRLIREDILITTILSPSLRPVRIDAGQMQQIILNLALNARDAMPDGGRLTIETDNVSFDEGDFVLLAVSDTGIGMSPATQARIFEPLFTTKEPGKGTGLGLAIVRTIVDQYGGHIEVGSELGHGSTFRIYLPQLQEPSPMSDSNPFPRILPRGSETILLVEDDDSVRDLTRHVLQACGYAVLEAVNGEEALDLAEPLDRPIDLLVSDVVMPLMGGRDLADRLLAARPQLKVLFLSGYPNGAVENQGVLESDFAFLQKPFSTGALAQKVREVLDAPAR